MTIRSAALAAAIAAAAAPAPAQDPLPPGAEPPRAKPVEIPLGGAGAFEVNGIAATVNGKAVTKNEVAFMLAPGAAQLVAQYPRRGEQFEKKLNEAREQVLQELIDRELILYEFKNEMGGSLRPQVVDQEIERQIRELYNGNEAELRKELQKARMTMDGYRQLTQDKLIVQAMRSRQFADAPPPLPSEVQQEYNEVKTQIRDTSKDKITFKRIFIPRITGNPGSTPETQLSLAEDLVKQLEAGADFAELAKTHSSDAYASEGGQWPETDRIDLSPEFAAILFDADQGKLLGPLEDPAGFSIVLVTDKQFGPSPPLSEVRDQIEERVRRKKTAARYDRWIERLRARAMIKRKM